MKSLHNDYIGATKAVTVPHRTMADTRVYFNNTVNNENLF